MTERIFHGSPELFDSFSLESSGRLTGASNGGLGVWVTPELSIAQSFGRSGYVYELAPPPGGVKEVPLEWLIARHDEAHALELGGAIAMYDEIRRGLLAKGYGQLWIIERDGSAPTRVYLDPDGIEILDVTAVSKDAKNEDLTPQPEPSF